MGEFAIRVRGVGKRYGEVVALDALDLDVPRGSIFGFLGPNGSGKTAAMRALLGVGYLAQLPRYLTRREASAWWTTGRWKVQALGLDGDPGGSAHGHAVGPTRDRPRDRGSLDQR